MGSHIPVKAAAESSTDCMRDADLDGYGDDSLGKLSLLGMIVMTTKIRCTKEPQNCVMDNSLATIKPPCNEELTPMVMAMLSVLWTRWLGWKCSRCGW